jgi:hypothetical protein
VFQRQIGIRAVRSFATQPFGQEALLGRALVLQVATEQRSQRRVRLDAVVQAVDQRLDRRSAADAVEQAAAGKWPRCLTRHQESTVLHAVQSQRNP